MTNNSVNNSVSKSPCKCRITRALEWDGIAYQGAEYLRSTGPVSLGALALADGFGAELGKRATS
jgi:hypothetical protein